MLKPEEIKNITFEQSVFSGYKKEDVDAFLDRVFSAYSKLYMENGELVGKLKVCVAKIEEYREDEQFLKSAIVNAQKLNETAMQEIDQKRKETEEMARKQAEEMLIRAKVQSDQLLSETDAKIAELREKTTRDFAEKKLENHRAFEEQNKIYDGKLAEKKAELLALSDKVEAFKAQALSLLEKHKQLLSKLPAIEAPSEKVENTVAVVEEVEIAEPVEAPVIAEETIEDTHIVEENVSEPENSVEETTDVVESEEIEQEETEVVANDVDLVETEEMPEDKDQINFDEVLAATPSPVEPEAPVLDQEDSAEDEVETPFNLFGGSALVFPSDISEDGEAPVDNDGNFKFRKKLKFGVDFDVKKDK